MEKKLLFMQSAIIGMKMALIEIQSHRLRSGLSIVGVLLGVAALVAMLSLVGGIDSFIKENMGKWAGVIWIEGNSSLITTANSLKKNSPGLRLSDGDFLERNSLDVGTFYKAISKEGWIEIGHKKVWASIKGVDLKSFSDNLYDAKKGWGTWFSKEDFSSGRKICIVSEDLANFLISKQVRRSLYNECETKNLYLSYQGVRFKVVGTIIPRSPESDPSNFEKMVIIPLVTMQHYISGIDPYPGTIKLTVADPEHVQILSQRISNVLLGRHRGVRDFECKMADWAESYQKMLKHIRLFMLIISFVSLTVGGLAIMNTMLLSISERLFEIGVRKALGAQDGHLFVQFITESSILCFTGGSIGVIIGCLPLYFSEAICRATNGTITPAIEPLQVVIIVLVISTVGILFGIYPALKAARINPIDALKYD